MNLLKNKKAKYFITMVCIFLILSLGTMLYFINQTQKQARLTGEIGQKSLNIIKTYQSAEETLFYIDMSAKYAAPNAYFLTAYMGALPEESKCGKYYNFVIWDFEDDNCLPMGAKKPVKYAFEKSMNSELNEFFSMAQDLGIPQDNYAVNVFEENNQLVVSGSAKKQIKFDIPKDITGATFYNSVPYAYYSSGDLFNNARVKYLLANNRYVTAEFLNMVVNVANDVGANPLDLMIVMNLESSFSPTIVNSIGCTGLIQFCPGGGMSLLHVTRAELVSMTATEQLDKYVRAYLKKEMEMYNVQRLNTLVLLYLSILYPDSMKDATNPDALVWKAGSKAQIANPVFTGGVRRDVYVRDIENSLMNVWNRVPEASDGGSDPQQ